jgi:hypothetical protein
MYVSKVFLFYSLRVSDVYDMGESLFNRDTCTTFGKHFSTFVKTSHFECT